MAGKRRWLAIFSVALLPVGAVTFLDAENSGEWPPGAAEHRAHMIGQSHIDAVWLWPWYESLSVVHSTFREALDRIKETPGFIFTASSAQFYEWIAENDPQMLSAIRRRVQEGRWDPVGGWWVEPDVNMPSGEALVRQGLYGQRTFERLLGRRATTGYNPDSFGHPGTLAQILKLQGMNNYVFMRPEAKAKTLPADLFWWQAPDGTKALTYRIPVSYNDDRAVDKRLREILAEVKPLPASFMAFYGAGDHGGGATKANIQSIEALQKEPGAPVVLFSSPDRYFQEVRKGAATSLPVYEGDLQHHAVGCYTAESQMKKWNRTTEIDLISAEKLAAIGSIAWGAAYPKEDFVTAWKRVLFLQFHDSLAGTALPEFYESTAPEGYGRARDIAAQALYKAAQKLAWQVPATDPDSQYLVAFNLQAWPVTADIEYDLHWRPGTPALVEEEDGRAIPHQLIPPTTEVNDRQRLVARVQIPAFGYRQIRIRKMQERPPGGDVHATGQTLENAYLRAEIGPDGAIGLLDKTNGAEVFSGGATGLRPLVMRDTSDTWSHDIRAYTDQIGAFGNAQTSVIENGPLRARLRVRSTYGNSTLTTDWILYAGARTLEARVSLDWHEHEKILKFSFPVNVTAPRSTYEIAYGNIVRDTNGDENPGQRWIDVSGQAGSRQYGLSVINNAKYGYSVEGNDMRVSVVRGAPFAWHNPQVLNPATEHNWQDQGMQNFRMLLVPHRGSWQNAGVQRITDEFTSPVPILYQGIHAGTRPQSASFLNAETQDLIISAIKKSEDGNDLILRCYETQGHATTGTIHLLFAHKDWSGSFRPYEIKTLRLNPVTGGIREVNALEE